MDRLRSESQAVVLQPACLSRTASSPSPSSETNFSSRTTLNWHCAPALVVPKPIHDDTKLILTSPPAGHGIGDRHRTSSKNVNANSLYNLDLQLATTSNANNPNNIEVSVSSSSKRDVDNHSTQLQLSIGSCDNFGDNHLHYQKNIYIESNRNSPRESSTSTNDHHHQQMKPAGASTSRIIKEEAREQLRLAMAEKAYAEEARQQAEQQIELAEQEFANAKRIRQQALAELDKAQALKEHAVKKINSTILQITCHACKQQFQARTRQANSHENSLVFSYMSSARTTTTTTEGDRLEINASATRTDDLAKSSANP